jgi:hypothetical protein
MDEARIDRKTSPPLIATEIHVPVSLFGDNWPKPIYETRPRLVTAVAPSEHL